MKGSNLVLLAVALFVGCSTSRLPPATPVTPTAKAEASFPRPTLSQSEQLAQLHPLLRGPVTKLDLAWVADMGAVAIPACTREASDETLSLEARDLILVVLGNTLKKADFYKSPDGKNDLVVTVLLKALNDPEPRVRRSAAFAARFVDDVRLVPALRQLLNDRAFVQEQAVLALGTSGREAEVVAIAKLFFETDNGTFRYSCLYSLATMCLLHDVDVASVLERNSATFGEKNLQNVDSVSRRFMEFNSITALLKKLSSGDASKRRDANEKLRKLTGKRVAFDPAANDAARRRGIEEWQKYLLKDYWLVPSPSPPSKP